MPVSQIRIIMAAIACALILFGLGQSARAATGTLLVMGVDETTGTIDLTAQGVLDWAHWGLNLPTDFDYHINPFGVPNAFGLDKKACDSTDRTFATENEMDKGFHRCIVGEVSMSNHPAATNPAMTTRCHAEGEMRRFVDRNRYAA